MSISYNRVYSWSSLLVWGIAACLGTITENLHADNLPKSSALVKIDALGNKVAVWEDTNQGTSTIVASNSLPSDTVWSEPQQISPAVDGVNLDSRAPKLSINASGEVVAAWLSTDTTNQVKTLYTATIQLQAGTPAWSSATAVSATNEALSHSFDISISDSHEMVAVWSSFIPKTSEWRVYAANSVDIVDNVWYSPTQIATPTTTAKYRTKQPAPAPAKKDPKKDKAANKPAKDKKSPPKDPKANLPQQDDRAVGKRGTAANPANAK